MGCFRSFLSQFKSSFGFFGLSWIVLGQFMSPFGSIWVSLSLLLGGFDSFWVVSDQFRPLFRSF